MASSEPVQHSCQHCQRLVLGLRRSKVTDKQIRSNLSRPSQSIDADNKVIFDITLPQMTHFAIDGCPLIQWILSDNSVARVDETEDLVLSAHTHQGSGMVFDIEQIEFFGLWDRKSKERRSTFTASLKPKIRRPQCSRPLPEPRVAKELPAHPIFVNSIPFYDLEKSSLHQSMF